MEGTEDASSSALHLSFVRFDCSVMYLLCCAFQVNDARRCITEQIRVLAEKQKKNGAVDEWFARADSQVREVNLQLLQYTSIAYCVCCVFLCLREATRGVNGPLLEALCKWSKYHDAECINMFRDGADLVGYLKASGNGVAIENEGFIDIGSLTSDAPAMNRLVSFIHMRLCRLRCLSLAPWCVVRLLLSGI